MKEAGRLKENMELKNTFWDTEKSFQTESLGKLSGKIIRTAIF